nr:MAG TPA: hypothetical protein [Caudoviricetes sp.]
MCLSSIISLLSCIRKETSKRSLYDAFISYCSLYEV